jgi:hypothetical protein
VLEPILATKPSVQLSNPIDESEQETQKILSLTIQGKIVQKPQESLIQTPHSMIQLNLEAEPAALPPATHTPAQSAPESVRANQVVLPPDTHMPAKPVALPPTTYAPVKPAFNAVRPNPAPLQPTIHIPARPASENIRPKLAPSPVHRTIELNQKKIARLHEESEQLQERLTVEDEEQSQFISMPAPLAPTVQPPPETKRESEQPSVQHIIDTRKPSEQIRAKNLKPTSVIPQEPAKTMAERIESTSEPTLQFAVSLNLEAISKLQEESAHLQERLVYETEEDQPEQLGSMSELEVAPATPVVRETAGSAPEVDGDWQIILQQWQPEHWEIISLLCQEQSIQLTTAERKDHRPVSRLIDEINSPVDEQLGDLLVDPDTQILSPHLRTIAESLVRWYYSSKGR